MRTQPVRLTAEDEAIFDRRHDSMDAQWLYEDQDRADADRCLMWTRDRIRWDLASPAVRIVEVML
jgi:hypothetical protein